MAVSIEVYEQARGNWQLIDAHAAGLKRLGNLFDSCYPGSTCSYLYRDQGRYLAIALAIEPSGISPNDVVGFATLVRSDQGDLFLKHSYTDESMRQQGVNTQLRTSLCSIAVSLGAQHVGVFSENPEVIVSFKRHGFRIVAEDDHHAQFEIDLTYWPVTA